ncbi:uncharacterized protein PGTG_03951 [Puccinia graminis f. sp. tritici CRL 75-36-700-3]|uniref:Uncharacterized protein n=1 Tax=Puccinia graminis f. sp. tritici (strain CRL 75-36-700-3 / race SCCL) TaxID=418459 RepID=E3K120_PUCGT|nr:uncharacterized protein PGTG_03951 [Puccinia graminis f. sp. tritici CRL 75-36-700-3]EFP77995.2 hypothetical protein PGTG_03951 [Puccinia graminis f. sp. tritici CRL 75-36-700-3]
MFQNNHVPRKRSASDELITASGSGSERSTPSADLSATKDGTVRKRTRVETESNEETCKPNEKASFGKPFRNPMMIGSRNRTRTQQQNQVLIIKQLESELVRLHDGQRILRDSAEYLWDLVGKNQSSEPKFNQIDSRTSWGYDNKYDAGRTNPKSGFVENQEGDRLEGSNWDSNLNPPEELPTAQEILGESTATRHYNVDGLADPSKSPNPLQPPSKFEIDDPVVTASKPNKDVGWMMEQMGLDASLFGWNSDEGTWTLS